jgi:hypothetical protein
VTEEELQAYVQSVHKEIDRAGGGPLALFGIVIGAASVCWSNPEGAGVFDSQRASALIDLLIARTQEGCR